MVEAGPGGGVAVDGALGDGSAAEVGDAVVAEVGDADAPGEVDATGCCPQAASSKTSANAGPGLMYAKRKDARIGIAAPYGFEKGFAPSCPRINSEVG